MSHSAGCGLVHRQQVSSRCADTWNLHPSFSSFTLCLQRQTLGFQLGRSERRWVCFYLDSTVCVFVSMVLTVKLSSSSSSSFFSSWMIQESTTVWSIPADPGAGLAKKTKRAKVWLSYHGYWPASCLLLLLSPKSDPRFILVLKSWEDFRSTFVLRWVPGRVSLFLFHNL